jgi:biotin transporter BioY
MEPTLLFVIALWAMGWLLEAIKPGPDQGTKNFVYLLFIVLIIVVVFIVGYHARGTLFS